MQLPGPLRAAVGLVATAAEEARHLPDRAIELPMLAVSTALQMSLRAQQRYARLAARGDEVLTRRRPSDDPPDWATFDGPPTSAGPDPVRGSSLARQSATAANQLLDELIGSRGPGKETRPVSTAPDAPAEAEAPVPAPTAAEPPTDPPNGRRSPRKTTARKTPRKTARKTATKSAPKSVSQPRHTAPSRFDAVGDDSTEDDTAADDGTDTDGSRTERPDRPDTN